jgi:hypothetical protein
MLDPAPEILRDAVEALISGGHRLRRQRDEMAEQLRSSLLSSDARGRAEGQAVEIAGERSRLSIADLIHRCQVHCGEEQARPSPDTRLIDTLCEAVRMAREYAANAARAEGQAHPLKCAGNPSGEHSPQALGDPLCGYCGIPIRTEIKHPARAEGQAHPDGAQGDAGEASTPATLTVRSAPELVQALRTRAKYLAGNVWEVPATAAMMREAAALLESQEEASTPLRALIQKWRAVVASMDTWYATMGTGYKACADELEAALASSLQPQRAKDGS